MIRQFINYIKKQKAESKKIDEDKYLTRLRNSRQQYCGHSHIGEGPFLDTREVKALMSEELKRRLNQDPS